MQGHCVSSPLFCCFVVLFFKELSNLIPTHSFCQAPPFLGYLSLHQNQLTGALPEFMNLRSLFYLDLSSNFFSGSIPHDWSSGRDRLNRLRHVYLDHNRFEGELLPTFSQIGNGRVETLMLSNNRFTGRFPGNWTKLEDLELQHNNFTSISKRLCKKIVFAGGEIIHFRADCDICSCKYLCGRDYCLM